MSYSTNKKPSKRNLRKRSNKKDRHADRVSRGNLENAIAETKPRVFNNQWKLDWFTPIGKQLDVVEDINTKLFTIIDGSSGVGKTSTAVWAALHGLSTGACEQVVFVKNPTEAGDDQLGFLKGDKDDKLVPHMDTTREIFQKFMSKEHLDYELARGGIKFAIPNFILGATLDNTIVVLDESQNFSEGTTKLLLERMGKNTRYIVMGDSHQRYAIKNRSDGFVDLINRVTQKDDEGEKESASYYVGYTRLTSDENRRSFGSKFITKLYEEDILIDG